MEFFHSLLSGGILSPKEYGMGRQDTKFYHRANLIDARGTLTAMDNLTGGETDRVQILRATELARKNACAGVFRGDEVNVVRPNHDDHGGAILALDRVGKLSQFGMDHAPGNGPMNKVCLTDKVRHEGCGRHVVHHFRGIELLQAALVEDGDAIRHGKCFVMVVCHEYGRGFLGAYVQPCQDPNC